MEMSRRHFLVGFVSLAALTSCAKMLPAPDAPKATTLLLFDIEGRELDRRVVQAVPRGDQAVITYVRPPGVIAIYRIEVWHEGIKVTTMVDRFTMHPSDTLTITLRLT